MGGSRRLAKIVRHCTPLEYANRGGKLLLVALPQVLPNRLLYPIVPAMIMLPILHSRTVDFGVDFGEFIDL